MLVVLRYQTNSGMGALKEYLVNNLKYKLPNIVDDKFDNLKVETINNVAILRINSQQWMGINLNTFNDVGEQYSHFELGRGHCICTGMGFLIRESWLLNNPLVTKITVIEKNESVIEYHKKHNPLILEKLNVVNCDVVDFKGECDVLLIDHYEWEKLDHIKKDISNILENIKCDTIWFWPIERYIKDMANKEGISYLESYHKIIDDINPKYFPDLNENQLKSYCDLFFAVNK